MIVKTIYTASVIKPASGHQLNKATAIATRGPASERITYHNFMSRPITVVSRNGFRQSIPPTTPPDFSQNDFVIRYEVDIDYAITDEFLQYLINADRGNNDEISMARQDYYKSMSRSIDGRTLVFETRYTLEDFTKINTCLYCSKRDKVISTKNIYEASPHPFDPNNVDEVTVSFIDDKIQYDSEIDYLTIIDNDNTIGDKWEVVRGKIRKIKAHTNYEKTSGIYHHHVVKDLVRSEKGFRVQIDHYTLDKAVELFQLHNSYEAAQLVNDKHTHESDLKLKNMEIEKMKAEYQSKDLIHKSIVDRMELENKLIQDELDKRKAARDEELENIKHENMKLKDRLDRDKAVRSDEADVRKIFRDDQAQERKHARDEETHRSKTKSDFWMKKLPDSLMDICGAISAIALIIGYIYKAKNT